MRTIHDPDTRPLSIRSKVGESACQGIGCVLTVVSEGAGV